MQQAREALAGKWGMVLGVSAAYLVIMFVMSSFKGFWSVVPFLFAGPLEIGVSLFALSVSRNKEAHLKQIFEGFENFGRSFAAYLLVVVLVLLWAILLIIPGVIAALAYSQTFFILAEDEKIGALDALRKSKKMMSGYKWQYFCLGLRFIGWFLLSVLTLGIGFLWFIPYMQVTTAKFYDEVKKCSEVSVA